MIDSTPKLYLPFARYRLLVELSDNSNERFKVLVVDRIERVLVRSKFSRHFADAVELLVDVSLNISVSESSTRHDVISERAELVIGLRS